MADTVQIPTEPPRELWAAMADSLAPIRDRLNIAHDFITEPIYRAIVEWAKTQ